MKDRIFGVLQRIGRSFMLPIAILPVAGLFLGIGGSFTNETMLKTYGLQNLLGQGTLLHAVLTVMNAAGNIVFANLPILFAIGVAIGMAKAEKEVAALSAAIAFFVMHASINALITINGGPEAMLEGAVSDVVGITSLQMGVFGGIIVGLGVAALHNRFYRIRLPQVLSFFGGTRFVPIISSVVYLGVGILMFFVWPPIQMGIYRIGDLVLRSGYVGTWIYGLMERALIPFGLHHVFYLPFWQTAVGGTAEVGGQLIEGAQNIFFAELGTAGIDRFSVSATRFMSGKFPLMIFGLPGAALAMYRSARPEKRSQVGGLLLSAALTSLLTGITEPIEFTFLFVAPLLYVIHCIFAGLAYMLMHVFGVGVGMTFSGGLIDLFLFGILQGNAKTNWIWIPVVGIFYFFVYFFLFSYLIRRFDYKTPGREEGEGEVKLYTRADVDARKNGQDHSAKVAEAGTSGRPDTVSALIVRGLGGKGNISDVDCCATRLRITVHEEHKVDEALLKESGAAGVIRKGKGIQVVYGPRVTVIKSDLEEYLGQEIEEYWPEPCTVYAPVNGTVVPLSEVKDGVFSEELLGKGFAVQPASGEIRAPFDGTVTMVYDTKHAIGIVGPGSVELLIHVGIDTVKLEGKYFDVQVNRGDVVKKGDLLAVVKLSGIRDAGYQTITPVIITNSDMFSDIKIIKYGKVTCKNAVLEIK